MPASLNQRRHTKHQADQSNSTWRTERSSRNAGQVLLRQPAPLAGFQISWQRQRANTRAVQAFLKDTLQNLGELLVDHSNARDN